MTIERVPYVVFGTGNKNKGIEATRIAAPSGVVLTTLAEIPNAIEVEEDGATFGENARKKAIEQAKHLGEWTLAEDSGICVDYLDGRPGAFRRRGTPGRQAQQREAPARTRGRSSRKTRGALRVSYGSFGSARRDRLRVRRILPRSNSLRGERFKRIRLRSSFRSSGISSDVRGFVSGAQERDQSPCAGDAPSCPDALRPRGARRSPLARTSSRLTTSPFTQHRETHDI